MKILIVEPDAQLASALSMLLHSCGRFGIIRTLFDHESLKREIVLHRPEVIVFGTNVPYATIPDKVKELRSSFPQLKYLLIADKFGKDTVLDAARIGIDGMLSLSDDLYNLASYVEAVCANKAPISPSVGRMLLAHLRINDGSPLSDRETEVLQLLSTGRTYTEISSHLSISPETSKTHIKNIYKKLNVNSKSQAIRRALNDRIIAPG